MASRQQATDDDISTGGWLPHPLDKKLLQLQMFLREHSIIVWEIPTTTLSHPKAMFLWECLYHLKKPIPICMSRGVCPTFHDWLAGGERTSLSGSNQTNVPVGTFWDLFCTKIHSLHSRSSLL
jgi:hypothetical protein